MALFTYPRRITFAETDAAGIVNFSRVFTWAEEAEHAFWKTQGFAIHPSSSSELPCPVGWPRIHCQAGYHRPLFLDDELTLFLRVQILDEYSLKWQVEIKAKDQLAAEVELMVSAAAKNAQGRWKKTPIPAEMLSSLQSGD